MNEKKSDPPVYADAIRTSDSVRAADDDARAAVPPMRIGLLVCIVCAAAALLNYAVLFVVTARLPASVPVHVNWELLVDRWGGVWEIRLFSLISVLFPVAALCAFRTTKPEKQNAKVVAVVIGAVTVLLLCASWMCVYAAFQFERAAAGQPVPAFMLLFILLPLAFTFMVIGNYSALIKPNKWLGIRTSSTFFDETVWRKTHRAAGFCGVGAGVFLLIMTIVCVRSGSTIAAFIGLGVAVLLMLAPLPYARFLVGSVRRNAEK